MSGWRALAAAFFDRELRKLADWQAKFVYVSERGLRAVPRCYAERYGDKLHRQMLQKGWIFLGVYHGEGEANWFIVDVVAVAGENGLRLPSRRRPHEPAAVSGGGWLWQQARAAGVRLDAA